MNDPNPTPTDPPTDPTPEPAPEPTPGLTLEQAMKELERTRKESANYRTKLRETEEAAARAALTDEERRKAELTDAQTKASAAEKRAQETALQLSVERQARKLGIVDEDAAFRLLDTAAVEFDESGKPSNVEALLKSLTESRPWLLGETKTAATGGTGSNPARPRTGGELSQKDLKTMTAQQIAALSPDVLAAALART